MKIKTFVSVVLLAVFILSNTLYINKVEAAELSSEERASMMAQIQSLLELIKALQAQLNAQKTASTKSPGVVTLIVPYGPPTAHGDLSVEQVGPLTLKLSGTLYPPTDCLTDKTNKIFEFQLDFQAGDSKTFELNDCKEKTFSETKIYTPSQVPVFPELIYRRVEIHNNTWMNYGQTKYIVNLSNPYNLDIKKLSIEGQQKG
ncbi:hypothetical protein KC872_00815 [Candidatus Kaiserbacteria bacterium]|nr:hypothetical protein [Candidatus Kaiserbacteria bacterium]